MTFYDPFRFLMGSRFEHHRDESYTHIGDKVRFRLEYSRLSAYHSSQNKKRPADLCINKVQRHGGIYYSSFYHGNRMLSIPMLTGMLKF